MSDLVGRVSRSLRRRWRRAHGNARIRRISRNVSEAQEALPGGEVPGEEAVGQEAAGQKPVVFFNASTRLEGVSLNAAYSLITSWAVRLSGVPVIYFVCDAGMLQCVLGTNRDEPASPPPCAGCTGQSQALFSHSTVRRFAFQGYPLLQKALEKRSVAELEQFEFKGMPLGELILPSMRWVLRRHHLLDNAPTRYLYVQYILSAWHVGQEFARLLEEAQPQAVVVFNGMFFPEAAARWVARQRGVRVVSHEVGLQPYTAYFTTGDATAYPIHIPEEFDLSPEQNQRLDAYLEKRMQGNFSMAGIRFWPEMRGLDQAFLERAAKYRQVVPVFTNVIFDTSQPHSNVVFPDMFAWLDQVVDLARAHPDTLFVIRAHPDETRSGKESRESVAEWVNRNEVCALPNVMFVESRQYFSSYELIQRAKFVMVYNSTIGLEAALMGAPVLCGGRARFTQLPTVFFPQSPENHRQQAEAFLAADTIEMPEEFKRNARRFLYYQLYRTSLPFDAFLEDDRVWQGYVRVKDLDASAFDPRKSPVLKVIVDGILYGEEFLLDE